MGYLGKEPRKDGGSLTLGATLDTNGNEIVLDADADSSITADTDDQIDIKVGGNDTAIIAADSVKIRSDNAGLIFRRTTSEADIAKIQYVNGNPSLDIGADGKNVRFTNGGSYAETMRVGTNGQITIQDGDLVIGTAGHGIDFSSSSDGAGSVSVSNEVLSDYDEGTWTPGFAALGDAGSTIAAADYTRVGRIVHLFFNITIVSTSDTSPIQISGLPFDGDGNKIQTQPNPFNNLGAGDLVPYVQGTAIFIGKSDTFADTTYANASGKFIRGNITYQIV